MITLLYSTQHSKDIDIGRGLYTLVTVVQMMCLVHAILTSTVLPLEAVRTSPGSIPFPSIMFSQDADMKWICSSSNTSLT